LPLRQTHWVDAPKLTAPGGQLGRVDTHWPLTALGGWPLWHVHRPPRRCCPDGQGVSGGSNGGPTSGGSPGGGGGGGGGAWVPRGEHLPRMRICPDGQLHEGTAAALGVQQSPVLGSWVVPVGHPDDTQSRLPSPPGLVPAGQHTPPATCPGGQQPVGSGTRPTGQQAPV